MTDLQQNTLFTFNMLCLFLLDDIENRENFDRIKCWLVTLGDTNSTEGSSSCMKCEKKIDFKRFCWTDFIFYKWNSKIDWDQMNWIMKLRMMMTFSLQFQQLSFSNKFSIEFGFLYSRVAMLNIFHINNLTSPRREWK